MSEAKMREEFEAWWNKACTNPDFGGRGEWMSWQAACAHKESEFAKEREQLRALIAMQAEALNGVRQHVSKTIHSPAFEFEKKAQIEIIEDVISASAESVAAWEAEKLEPLRSQVAMLNEFVGHCLSAVDNLQDLPISDKWATNWADKASDMLEKHNHYRESRATAEAYERELKAKVLEEAQMFCEEEAARIRLDDVRATTVAVVTATSIAHHFNFEAAELRTQSAQKKGGE